MVAADGPQAELVPRGGYNSAAWSMDHLDAGENDPNDVERIDVRMGHRTSTSSPTVHIEEGSRPLTSIWCWI